VTAAAIAHDGPRIEPAEFAARRAALDEALDARGIAAWIAFADDRQFVGGDHVRYLCDLMPHFEGALLAARVGAEPIVMTGPETAGHAQVAAERVPVAGIHVLDELCVPGLDYPTIATRRGVELLRDLTDGAARVGLLGGADMPRSLSRVLPDGREYVDADDIAYALRAIKSPREHAVLDWIYAVTADAMRALAAAVRPGVSERELAAVAEHAMRAAGAEGFAIDTIVASGATNTRPVITRASGRRLREGDLVSVTLGPRYEGYCISFARPFVLGDNPDALRAVEAGRQAEAAAADLLLTGEPGWAAAAAAKRVVDEAGLGAAVSEMWVHSSGVVEFEPPFLTPASGERLREGMAVSIDIPIFAAPWGGLRIEDGFAIGPAGARPRIADYGSVVPVSPWP